MRISGKSYEALRGYLTDHKLVRWRWRSHTRVCPRDVPGQLGFTPRQNRVLSARCGLGTRQLAFIDNIYLRHNAWAVNIKLRHNTPSGTKRRKPKDCHLGVFVQNCHTSAEIPFMAERIHEEGVEPLSSGVRPQN